MCWDHSTERTPPWWLGQHGKGWQLRKLNKGDIFSAVLCKRVQYGNSFGSFGYKDFPPLPVNEWVEASDGPFQVLLRRSAALAYGRDSSTLGSSMHSSGGSRFVLCRVAWKFPMCVCKPCLDCFRPGLALETMHVKILNVVGIFSLQDGGLVRWPMRMKRAELNAYSAAGKQ